MAVVVNVVVAHTTVVAIIAVNSDDDIEENSVEISEKHSSKRIHRKNAKNSLKFKCTCAAKQLQLIQISSLTRI